MHNDFSRIDFALVEAPTERVIEILAKKAWDDDNASAEKAAIPLASAKPSFGNRILGRFLGTKSEHGRTVSASMDDPHSAHAPIEPGPPVLLHTGSAAETNRLIEGAEDTFDIHANVRISAILAKPGWTLVEFVEPGSGMSAMAYGLSNDLGGQEVLYFRRTGNDTPSHQFDFHVYSDHNQSRRVMTHFNHLEHAPEDSAWESTSDYEPHPIEDPALYEGATEENLLTAAKQDFLLARLDLSMDRLFGQGSRQGTVLLSRKPGGESLARFADVELPEDPHADIEARPVLLTEMVGGMKEVFSEVRKQAEGTPPAETINKNVGERGVLAERLDLAIAADRDPVPTYRTKQDAWRGMTRLLLECGVEPDDTKFWIGRLLNKLDTVNWDDVYDEVTDFVLAARVSREDRKNMMLRAEGILDQLSA